MNLLITSVGRRSYMIEYFKSAIGSSGAVHAANSDLTYALQTADHFVITPPIYDKSYIEFLLEYCRKNQISGIISLFDIDLPILSENKSRFNSLGIQVIVSDPEIMSICNDKWKTFQFLSMNGFATPKTYLSLNQALESVEKGKINFPLIIKPRWGMGSIGIYEADNALEAKVFYNKTKNIILKTYLKYESSSALDESVILQEKISGSEYGLDILNDLKGNYLCCVPKKKLAMRAGETDIARVLIDPELIALGQRLSAYTQHIGNLDADFFVGENNEYYILELNCRFGGQYPFSHMAGVNFPNVIISLLKGENPDKKYLNFEEVTSHKDLVIRRNYFD